MYPQSFTMLSLGKVCGKISRAYCKLCEKISMDLNNLTDREKKILKKMIAEQELMRTCSVSIIMVTDEHEEKERNEILDKLKKNQETRALLNEVRCLFDYYGPLMNNYISKINFIIYGNFRIQN